MPAGAITAGQVIAEGKEIANFGTQPGRATADQASAAAPPDDATLYLSVLKARPGRALPPIINPTTLSLAVSSHAIERPSKLDKRKGGNAVNRPRAADDFAAIRARMEELRQEREGTKPSDKVAQRRTPTPRGGAIRWPPSETSVGPGRVRQSG